MSIIRNRDLPDHIFPWFLRRDPGGWLHCSTGTHLPQTVVAVQTPLGHTQSLHERPGAAQAPDKDEVGAPGLSAASQSPSLAASCL